MFEFSFMRDRHNQVVCTKKFTVTMVIVLYDEGVKLE